MSRVKKWFATIFSCIKQDHFSGELVCSYPTLIIPENVPIPSSYTPDPAVDFPASNAIQLEEKKKNEKDFFDLILLPTDDIPSSENPPVDVDTNDNQKHSKILRNNEEEEYEALSFRKFIFKKESRKHEEEEAQIHEQIPVPEDEGFSFWPEENTAYNVLKQISDFSHREEEHAEQDDEKSVSLKDLWINQESENQARKEGADDQIPAERILEEIKNQIKPMRLSFNGRSTNRFIVMDPSVDFSAGFSIKSSSSSRTSSILLSMLRFRVQNCCLSHQIRKADILLSMLRLKYRILKVASSWAHAHDNAGIENHSKGKAALKTFFFVAH